MQRLGLAKAIKLVSACSAYDRVMLQSPDAQTLIRTQIEMIKKAL
jgi:hypothetical protein